MKPTKATIRNKGVLIKKINYLVILTYQNVNLNTDGLHTCKYGFGVFFF